MVITAANELSYEIFIAGTQTNQYELVFFYISQVTKVLIVQSKIYSNTPFKFWEILISDIIRLHELDCSFMRTINH